MSNAPEMSSATGMVTPTSQRDQIGKKVSAKARKFFLACSNGPN